MFFVLHSKFYFSSYRAFLEVQQIYFLLSFFAKIIPYFI